VEQAITTLIRVTEPLEKPVLDRHMELFYKFTIYEWRHMKINKNWAIIPSYTSFLIEKAYLNNKREVRCLKFKFHPPEKM
jgi:hypothetical protein